MPSIGFRRRIIIQHIAISATTSGGGGSPVDPATYDFFGPRYFGMRYFGVRYFP